jgi:hypothetical protein
MALALEQSVPPASAREVSEWVERVAGSVLAERASRVAAIESGNVDAEVIVPEGEAGETRVDRAPAADALSNDAAGTRRAVSRRWRTAIAVSGAVALFGGALVLLLRTRAAPAPHEGAAIPTSTASATIEAIAPPATADAGVSLATAAPPSATSPPRPAAVAPKKPRAAAADCNPPFSWDAMGKKHYKAQCL